MIKLLIEFIKKVGNGIFYSFDNKCDTGFDPRKLTAWAIILLAGYSHIHYVDQSVIVETLIVDYLFISLLLGIVTMEQIIKFKAVKNEPKQEDQKP